MQNLVNYKLKELFLKQRKSLKKENKLQLKENQKDFIKNIKKELDKQKMI